MISGCIYVVYIFTYNFVVVFLFMQELFLQDIAKESYTYTMSSKRKTVQRKDMGKDSILLKIVNEKSTSRLIRFNDYYYYCVSSFVFKKTKIEKLS